MMMKERLALCCLLMLVLMSCDLSSDERQKRALYNEFCSRCHIAPDPSNIPKNIWDDHVLPEMASRSGFRFGADDPLGVYSMEDNLFGTRNNIPPEEPVIDQASWQKIRDFLMSFAPDSIPVDRLTKNRNSNLVQFKPTPLFVDNSNLGGIVNIQFDKASHQFIIGDVSGRCYKWPEPSNTNLHFGSPIMFYLQEGAETYIMEVGFMNPSEEALGLMYRIKSGKADTLAVKLHRPVHSKVIDLNDDGRNEVLICEFGDRSGQLTILVDSDSGIVKRTLLPLPGTIKIEITDLNEDNLKDIVVLASQGVEGIYVLYQEKELQFRQETLIEMGPEYGSSWFELVDYDADNDLDIVFVNGDNADYSIFPKPYHGLRLFLNNGKNEFKEKWFYPIYGATRVLAEDYDLDGDLDFAVMAFFPDYDYTPEEGFVYLENKSPSKFRFETYTFPMAASSRWLVMDCGDYDQDGDIDIMMGSYLLTPGEENATIAKHWEDEDLKLLLLENKAKD